MSETTLTPAETEAAAIEEAKAQAEAMAQGKRDAANALAPRGLLYVASTTANLLAYFEAYDAELAERAADESISYATTEAYRRLLRNAQHPNGQAHRAKLRERAEAERVAEAETVVDDEASDERPQFVGDDESISAALRVEKFLDHWITRAHNGDTIHALGFMEDDVVTEAKLTVGDLRHLVAAARR